MNEDILREFDSSTIYGEDCKYEDSFLLIEQEIDKDFSVTQDGGTDWNFIVKNSAQLLINNSKDLKLASWWLYGLWKIDSWEGLEYGLNTYNHLINKYFKGLFPKSNKAKINMILWLEESLSRDILAIKSNSLNIENSINLYELYTNLNLLIKENFNIEENYFKKIINLLKSIIDEKNKEISKEENVSLNEYKKIEQLEVDEKNKEIIHSKSVIEEIDEINSDADAIKVLRTFKKNASLLSNYYRKSNHADLKALRITRLLSWLDTEGLPYADGKKTFLHPPSELELDDLESLYKNASYDEALYLAEEIIEVCPFWLDGHLYIFNILEKTKNFAAANEVKNTLSCFIKINEGILDFTFMDDKPFASIKTKKWIEKDTNINKIAASEVKKEPTQNDDTFEKIYSLANNGNIYDAMYSLEEKFNTSKSIEEKFNWRLKHAQLAIEFEEKNIALALLEELEKDIEKYHLNEWNPSLASEVYTLLLTSFTSVDIQNDKLETFYKNLCKTDISSALKIKIN